MLDIDSLGIYHSPKIIFMEQAAESIQQLKSQGKSVGLCNGGFDVTHPGHVKHFESAKKLCDVLVVAVTADRFVAGRKGSGRPVYTEKLRAYMISCLEFVDYVFISDFKSGIDIITALKPSSYIKGSDYISKTTPGITAEREAIQSVGGEMRYTTEPPMSTTKIIEYIKTVDVPTLLAVIDRDGTLIKNNNFFGKNNNWMNELEFNNEVVNYLSYLQTKYKTTKVIVTNQAGVAQGLFTCQRVEEINKQIHSQLALKGIKIDNWQYCPDADKAYAEAKKNKNSSRPKGRGIFNVSDTPSDDGELIQNNPTTASGGVSETNELTFDSQYVKEKTKRKPSPAMLYDALQQLNKDISNFTQVLVLGDREEDEGLAKNLKAKFIDVKGKSYEELVREFS